MLAHRLLGDCSSSLSVSCLSLASMRCEPWHLGCFHVLVIVISAAMNIRVHVSFQINVFFFSNKYPGVELLAYVVVLFLFF